MNAAARSTKAGTTGIEDRNAVVEKYAYLIKKVAFKLIARLPANVELDDLMSTGVIGLIDAADRFDPNKSGSFRSYAEIRIRGAMVDELRSLDWVPRGVRQKSANIDLTARGLAQRLGRPATHAEIAAEMGLTVPEFQQVRDKARPVAVVSYEDLGNKGGEDRRDFLDCVADPGAECPESSSQINNRREVILNAIQELAERQRVVLSLYYFEELTQHEIGTLLGVTESRICQILKDAIAQLRPILEDMLD